MSRKICVITGSRAEYGLLRPIMAKIRGSKTLVLQVAVTGMHLAPEFGLTYREIESDGFTIDCKVDMLLGSDTPPAVSKSIGLGVIGFGDALRSLGPDMIMVLGDRFEILAAVIAAMVARIPVAHLHGGETSEGVIDEAVRHSITKMSHIHFVAAEAYRKRVIQLGEHPDRVHLVGGIGIDNIKKLQLKDRNELEAELGLKFGPKNLLVTFHPATLENNSARAQTQELLSAVGQLNDTVLIFTMPNADMESRVISELINEFVLCHSNAHAFTSLGQIRYLSCIKYVDGVVGNSSSGLIEVPSFHKGTVNIGDRQRGRLKAPSVIDCEPERRSISQAISLLYSAEFQETLASVENPYGEGGACEKVVKAIEESSFEGILKKPFFDLY